LVGVGGVPNGTLASTSATASPPVLEEVEGSAAAAVMCEDASMNVTLPGFVETRVRRVKQHQCVEYTLVPTTRNSSGHGVRDMRGAPGES